MADKRGRVSISLIDPVHKRTKAASKEDGRSIEKFLDRLVPVALDHLDFLKANSKGKL